MTPLAGIALNTTHWARRNEFGPVIMKMMGMAR